MSARGTSAEDGVFIGGGKREGVSGICEDDTFVYMRFSIVSDRK